MAEVESPPVQTNGARAKNNMLIKKETIRNYVGKDLRIYVDFFPALDNEVKKLVERAIERAHGHRQNSLMAVHL